MEPLQGKVGIVTGGTSGIGASVVRRASKLGAQIAYCARKPPSSVAPPPAEFFAVDLRQSGEIERFCAAVHDLMGRIDFVVTCAGLTLQGSLNEGDPDMWRAVVETNVLGTAFTCRAALPWMLADGGGHLVLVGSVAGRGTHAGEPVYLASKWAIVGLSQALRQELRGDRVRVTLVEPGIVDTPMTRGSPGAKEWLAAVEPLQPDDVAQAIVYSLCQPPRVSINDVLLRPSAQEL
jgi:NADP-dependent 3-hydroxy acid dehydrogenase YdfG